MILFLCWITTWHLNLNHNLLTAEQMISTNRLEITSQGQSVFTTRCINVYHFDIVLSLSVLYLNRSSVKGVRVEATAHPSHRAAAALACKSSHHSRQQKTTLWIHRSLRIKHTLRWWTHEQRTPLPCHKRLGIITNFLILFWHGENSCEQDQFSPLSSLHLYSVSGATQLLTIMPNPQHYFFCWLQILHG